MPPQQLIIIFPFGAVVGWCGVRGVKSGLILHWMSKKLQVSNRRLKRPQPAGHIGKTQKKPAYGQLLSGLFVREWRSVGLFWSLVSFSLSHVAST